MKRVARMSGAITTMLLVVTVMASANLYAQGPRGRHLFGQGDAVGSWFGRAIPLDPPCTPGTEGCPVPPEIIMVFTIHEGGTFIGIDSNIFAGGEHSTAHGEWYRNKPGSIKASFTFLQSAEGHFIGGFKNLFSGTLIDTNTMEGEIDAYLYLYVNEDGSVNIGEDGLPSLNPLSDPADCADQAPYCSALGKFTFKVSRVGVQEIDQ